MPNLERYEDLYSISNQKQEEESKEESIIISDQEDKLGFDQRKRNEKLTTTTQREFLKSTIKKKQNTIKEISAKYSISRSVLNKIACSNRMKLPVRAAKEYIKLKYRQKKELLSKIKNYWKMTEHTFSAANVTEYVNKQINEVYSVQFVRAFMKEVAKLTIKKVKQRPSSINFAKIKESRRLFVSKLGKLLTWETLVINIDESSINRHIKNSYSWSEKVIQKEAKSIIFSGNVNLVLAIC